MHKSRRPIIRQLMRNIGRTRLHSLSPSGPLCMQHSPLAGFEHHAAARIWPRLEVGQSLRLEREPDNPHDPSAVAVYWQDYHLGYLPRQQNFIVAHQLDNRLPIEARIAGLALSDNPWKRVNIAIQLSH